jgi:prophage regulatory protein
MTDRFLRLPEVRRITAVSRSTIYLKIAQGLLPPPISLGARTIAWRESEIATMNAARVRGASDDELRSLVVSLCVARKTAA